MYFKLIFSSITKPFSLFILVYINTLHVTSSKVRCKSTFVTVCQSQSNILRIITYKRTRLLGYTGFVVIADRKSSEGLKETKKYNNNSCINF